MRKMSNIEPGCKVYKPEIWVGKEGEDIVYHAYYYDILKDLYGNPKLDVLKSVQYREAPYNFEAVYIVNQMFNLQHSYVEYLIQVVFDMCYIVRGVFLVGKGNHVEVNVDIKQIIINCILCGGEKFVLIHNHPDDGDQFSKEDIENCKLFEELNSTVLNQCGLEYKDDLLITGNDWFTSYKENEKYHYSIAEKYASLKTMYKKVEDYIEYPVNEEEEDYIEY